MQFMGGKTEHSVIEADLGDAIPGSAVLDGVAIVKIIQAFKQQPEELVCQ
jgi:hypothetical protein